jgi:hypothetical protein
VQISPAKTAKTNNQYGKSVGSVKAINSQIVKDSKSSRETQRAKPGKTFDSLNDYSAPRKQRMVLRQAVAPNRFDVRCSST